MRPNQPLSMSDMVVVKSSCDVRALTYCDLKLLHIPGIVEVLWLYPDFKDKFAEDIIHDLTYNLREGYVVEVSILHCRHSSQSPKECGDSSETDTTTIL